MKSLAGLGVCLLLIAADSKVENDAKGKKHEEAIAGEWKVATLAVDGNEIEDAKGQKFTFKGSKLTREAPEGTQTYTFKLDPSKKPAEVDFVPEEGDNKGKTLKGIYTLKNEEFRVYLTLSPDGKRPKDFDSKDGEQLVLVVLKRGK
jgi:uncharacterized protein (TIGR03067 family)